MTLDTFIINDTTHIIAQKIDGTIHFLFREHGKRHNKTFQIEPTQLLSLSDFIINISSQYCESPYDKILIMVSYVTGVPISQIRSRSRKGDVPIARHLVNHFSRKHYTLASITGLTGYDHSTILHSSKVIYNILETKYPQIHYDWIMTIKNRLYGNT